MHVRTQSPKAHALGPKRYLLFEDIWQVLCLFIIVGADRKTCAYNTDAKLEKYKKDGEKTRPPYNSRNMKNSYRGKDCAKRSTAFLLALRLSAHILFHPCSVHSPWGTACEPMIMIWSQNQNLTRERARQTHRDVDKEKKSCS